MYTFYLQNGYFIIWNKMTTFETFPSYLKIIPKLMETQWGYLSVARNNLMLFFKHPSPNTFGKN